MRTQSHSAPVSLIVTNSVVSSGDFQLAVIQPFPVNVDAGSQPTAKVSVTPNYGSLLNASCDASAIPGANCSVSPTSIQTTANTRGIERSSFLLITCPTILPPAPITST